MNNNSKYEETATKFEESLNETGNGIYNHLLTVTCAIILLAIGIDLLGFSLVIAAACDLKLTVTEKGIITSLPFVGIILSSFFWGYISDTRGRKWTLKVSLLMTFIISCVSSLSPNWITLGILKFLSVFFSCAANSVTYTLVGESCIQRVRSKYMLMMTCLLLLSPAAAAMLAYPTLKLDVAVELPLLGIVFRPWRLLIILMAIPSGVGGLLICFFQESPKFLANWGRNEEALKALSSIYAVNHGCSKGECNVQSLVLEESSVKKYDSLCKAMYEQSAPLFRRPILWRTLQLFYIVIVVYATNNSFLVWLPHILSSVRRALSSNRTGNICSLISTIDGQSTTLESTTIFNYVETSTEYGIYNDTAVLSSYTNQYCINKVDDNVILTIIISQCIFVFFNFVIAFLPYRRKAVLIFILFLSAISGACVNITPEPISSVIFFTIFTCTCLCMGILSSFSVDLYSTSYRGMATCLCIMAGRSSAFFGINLVGNVIYNHCQVTFYAWSIFVLSGIIAAWFLPPDKKADKPSSKQGV